MIEHNIILSETDEINKKLLTEEDILNLIGFPLDKYTCNLDDCDKEIMVDLIFEELIDLEDDPSDISCCEIIKEPVLLENPILINEYVFKDCNYTDKGIEDLSFTLGYELLEVI